MASRAVPPRPVPSRPVPSRRKAPTRSLERDLWEAGHELGFISTAKSTIEGFSIRIDERQVRICLTNKGLAVQEKTRAIPDCIIAQSGMSVAAMTDLQSRIMALRDNLRHAPAAP